MNLKKLFFLFLLTFPIFLSGQPYGNEWIDHNQAYYKFGVVQPGVYRIDQNDLNATGISVSGLDPRNIQIFAKGKEIPIYIQGESDGSFDSGDYIEFYAEGNDGFADEEFYGSKSLQANPYYSLFTDTLYYFLTWNSSLSNHRFSTENDVNYSAYSASNFVWKWNWVDYHSAYFEGKTESGGGTDPSYVESEGWLDFVLNIGASSTRTVPTPNVYTSGPSASIHWKVIGESDYSRLVIDHHLNVQFAGQTFDTLYGGYASVDKTFQVSPSQLGSTNTSFLFRSINDLGSGADRSALSFIEIKYPHQLSFNNSQTFSFYLNDHASQSKSYLSFSNFSSSGQVWLYDLTNEKRIVVTSASGNHQVLIPNSGGEKQCFAFSEGNVLSINPLKPVNGNGQFVDYSALDRSNAFLIIASNPLLNEAGQYATYRNSTGFGSLVVNVNDLYDQFMYGIRTHPYSIRRFSDFIWDNWTNEPSYLFLFGKSIKAKDCRKNATNFVSNQVPSFGNPASDIMLTAGLNGTLLEPLMPTGRLSASTGTEANYYLNKVMEFESNPPKAWMKNILHFAGGTSGQESNRFLSYLNAYKAILEDTSFGGKVLTFKKNTTAPIQISLSDSIRNTINEGASLMTFFGHASSTGGFDQNIDDPENYSNKGKYPLLVGNSCFTGDIHEDHGESVSEKFVLIKDKGMIGFLASVDLGFESRLNNYSRYFFKSLGQENYGSGIGNHMIYAIQNLQLGGTTFPNRSVALLMTLHGDPSLVVNAHPEPDFVLTSDKVSTTPEIVTTALDTFLLNLEIFNYGKAVNDSLGIEVIQSRPDLTTEIFTLKSAPVKFSNTVALKIPIDAISSAGYHRFDIHVDPSNLIPEMNETNNSVSFNLFIKSGDLIPVLPYNFALVPNQNITLKASTGYSFEQEQEYEFQLDTTDLFTSPLETFKTLSEGGVVSWQPSLLKQMEDSAVYFWRTRNANGDENSVWRLHSFQYIPGKRGWSQDHFFQFRTDPKLFVEMSDASRQFSFAPSTRKLSCQTSSTLNFSDLGDILYKIDADLQEYGGCGLGPAIHIAVLDSLTFEAWGTPYQGENSNHYFGQLNKDGNCGKPRVQKFFIFQANSSSQLAGLKDMLVNKVPDGNYILAWTWVRNDFSSWDAIDPTLRSVFTNLGSDTIDDIVNDSLPYIFFAQKGRPSSAIEVLGDSWDKFIYLNADLINNSTYGTMSSPFIGPSSAWDSLVWDYFPLENPSTDSINLTLTAYSLDLKNVMSKKTFEQSERKEDLSVLINAETAPYLDMNMYLSDNAAQTAPQTDRWMVFYEGVMDLALNANEYFEFYADTLQEGDRLSAGVAVKNISEYDADSVLVSVYIFNKNRKRIDISNTRYADLPADSSFRVNLDFSTLGYKGNNTLYIEVNPNRDQVELAHFNNIGQIPFFVKGDNTNPVLDVTFDGVHILDGDIVSAKPEINVQLSDENPFLLLTDTSDMNLFVTDPNGNEEQFYFQNSSQEYEMEFIPPSGNKNKAKIIFRPSFQEDGQYALRVQARDRSNNESGSVDYRISFEVINKSTITNLMNYPNPFSTSTRFVFVLTGSKVPDNMQIQIMTISGKVVKNIYMYELGPIRVGRNVTEYAWDGRDDYGDKLANGVYLYRVVTRLNGKEIEQRSTSADSFFKKGFGKMVILR